MGGRREEVLSLPWHACCFKNQNETATLQIVCSQDPVSMVMFIAVYVYESLRCTVRGRNPPCSH